MNTIWLGLALAVGAPALKDKDKASAIVGEWVVESVTSNGRSLDRGGGLRYTFTPDGQWVIQRDGKEAPIPGGGTRTYSIDPKADPLAVDLVIGQPAGVAARLLGIYKIEGDTLTICATSAGKRLTRFDGPPDPDVNVYVLKRVKKEYGIRAERSRRAPSNKVTEPPEGPRP